MSAIKPAVSIPAEARLDHSPVPVVCPHCHGRLAEDARNVWCADCQRRFPRHNGFADLIVGDRYMDPIDEAHMLAEEENLRDTTERYWVPLFRGFWPRPAVRPRLLSLGCGVGTDIEVLTGAGFDPVGIDCGERTAAWHRRREPSRFVLANGKRLPFEDGSFDAVFCGCVFPHIGVQGSSYSLEPDWRAQRLELAREMSRVLKPGGKVVVASPNRWFPLDIFHEHTAERVRMRPNWPWDRLLLSRGDYQQLFRDAGAARSRASTLPNERYWSFAHSRRSLKGRLLAVPVRSVFWLVSRSWLSSLRSSPLNPWIVVLIEPRP